MLWALLFAAGNGVMQPLDGQTFGISRPMTGADAVDAIDRLVRIVDQADPAPASEPRGGRLP